MIIKKKLRTIGGSWGLIIPKVLLQALEIDPMLDDVGMVIEDGAIKLIKCKKED